MGDCEMAIVGGVNTILKPFEHISFGNAGMLSEDGRCKTFSDRANGYVRGEGVGMLFLKKLSAAERDGDSIYAIIRGSAENHGGRANSLTAPNPIAQASLLRAAYKKAAIDPRTVGYIEAHGTGTELGDPIEVNALKNAFKDLYNETGGTQMAQVHCGLGSVKSNIGHLELAAGIAGVIKVLLQFKHETRVKTLHCDTINPYIDLKDSPFYIVQENDHWHRIKDQQGNELPRRAGVSSFGFGGANAHVVLEEYIVKESEHKPQANDNYLIVLSAKTETSLKAAARNLKEYLATNEEANLSSIAYTLQVGRDEMEERIALIIQSREELINKLNDFLDGKEAIDLFYRGQIKRNKGAFAEFTIDEEIEKAIGIWIAKGKYEKLLNFWGKGLVIDWQKLYGVNKPKRINLPSYAFEKERHWIDTEQIENTNAKPAILHPLLHFNTSDFIQQSYKSTFSGEEFFLKDHQVQGQRVLPGVAYLEMARVAIALASHIEPELTILELHNTVWLKPLVVEGHKDVSIALAENFKDSSSIDQIDYEIYSQGNEEEIIHCQGQAILSQRTTTDMLDLEKLKGQMGCKTINGTDLYAIFTQIGFNYGQAFQGVKTIFIGEEELLAQLQLPPIIEGKSEYNDFLLHPSLMDSALQSSFGLIADLNHIPSKPFVPFALEHIRIISACTSEMFSWVRYSPDSKPNDKLIKFDIDLCDQQGNICVQMQGFSFRVLEGEVKSSHQKTNSDSHFDDSYYQKLMEKVLKNEISVDEAVELA
jgi:polyketide synthase PksN